MKSIQRANLWIVATILVILAGTGLFQLSPVEAQSTRGIAYSFTAQTTVGATAGRLVIGSGNSSATGAPINQVAELIVTGAPATCTYRLQGSADNVTWYNLSAADLTCTSTTVGFEANKPAKYVRGNLLTLTGGTAPTITLKYLGK